MSNRPAQTETQTTHPSSKRACHWNAEGTSYKNDARLVRARGHSLKRVAVIAFLFPLAAPVHVDPWGFHCNFPISFSYVWTLVQNLFWTPICPDPLDPQAAATHSCEVVARTAARPFLDWLWSLRLPARFFACNANVCLGLCAPIAAPAQRKHEAVNTNVNSMFPKSLPDFW